MATVEVKLGTLAYPVWVESGLLRRLGEVVAPHLAGTQVALVTDSHVAALYGAQVSDSLATAGLEVHQYVLRAGEQAKSLRSCQWLWGRLVADRLDRSATIIALGGGVIGDLAGFVAATYLRGIGLMHVPTTLLAQVDSSVGGKTGVNHPAGKNLIGAFYHPLCVAADPSVLATLKRRDLYAGFAEVLKYAVVAHPHLFHVLGEKLQALLSLREDKSLAWVIAECCRVKARIVARDEREQGMRRMLNFGHTIGHALEAATMYRTFRHGEAVLLGMRGATWLSARRGLLSGEEAQEIMCLLERLSCPVDLSRIEAHAVVRCIATDKKHHARRLHFVGLQAIGWPQIISDVTEEELLAATEFALGGGERQ
jgi:3-dehydroquinate synthase